MAYNNKNSDGNWQDKVKKFLKYAIVIVLIIWLFVTAFGARNTANENSEILMTPEFTVYHVAEGPERFSSVYEEAENVEDVGEINKSSYLWSTLIFQNTGEEDGEDIEITINATSPMQEVLITPPGWGNEVEVEISEDNIANINMSDFGTGEETYVFIAMKPSGYQNINETSVKKEWVNEFDTYLQKVAITSDQAEKIVYSKGYSGYLN